MGSGESSQFFPSCQRRDQGHGRDWLRRQSFDSCVWAGTIERVDRSHEDLKYEWKQKKDMGYAPVFCLWVVVFLMLLHCFSTKKSEMEISSFDPSVWVLKLTANVFQLAIYLLKEFWRAELKQSEAVCTWHFGRNAVIGFGVIRKLPFVCLILESWGWFFFFLWKMDTDFFFKTTSFRLTEKKQAKI